MNGVHAPAVPLVGQPMKIHEAFALATVSCTCRPDNPSMLIRGTDAIVGCGRCGRRFVITQVRFDRAAGMSSPEVTVALMTARPAVAQ